MKHIHTNYENLAKLTRTTLRLTLPYAGYSQKETEIIANEAYHFIKDELPKYVESFNKAIELINALIELIGGKRLPELLEHGVSHLFKTLISEREGADLAFNAIASATKPFIPTLKYYASKTTKEEQDQDNVAMPENTSQLSTPAA